MEENLTGEIDYDKAAQLTLCSTYHFQRMFSFITGVPLSEYIRRRRLTLAAFELQNTEIKVIDLAYKYGYNSPNSFTRAFQLLHGVTPSAARSSGVCLKAYPRISFHISIKGDVEMNYKIEEKEAFSVFGVEETFSVIEGQCYRDIPKFWLRIMEDGTLERMRTLASGKNATIQGEVFGNDDMLLNAAMYGHKSDGSVKYMICAFTPEGEIPNDYKKLEVPKLTWAIFPSEKHPENETTEKVQKIWQKIFSEWFPTSGFEHADAPEFEMYRKVDQNQFIVEVWIPVIKR
jgi:AraC family transcriptional regulator